MSEKQPEQKSEHDSLEISPLKIAAEEREQYFEDIDSQLGDFNVWNTPADDPRWDVIHALPPADLSYLSSKKRDQQERAIKRSDVAHLQTIPKNERGGAWNFANTDMMNMNGDPLELTNPDAARQFKMDRASKDIEASLENQKPKASRVASAILNRLVRK